MNRRLPSALAASSDARPMIRPAGPEPDDMCAHPRLSTVPAARTRQGRWVVLRAYHIDDPDCRSAGETCCRDDPPARIQSLVSSQVSRTASCHSGSCRVRACPPGTSTADPVPAPAHQDAQATRDDRRGHLSPTRRARRLHHLAYPLRIPSRSGLGGQMRFTKGARAVSLQDQYVHNWRTNDRIGTLPPRRAARRGGA
jgi:hypothetical protein